MGDARLVRTDTGVSFNLRTTGLTHGDATSIWWVIFNNPDECSEGVCELSDLFNPAVAASVQSGGGNMVGASGRSAYAGHLSIGQVTNAHPFVHADYDGRADDPDPVPNPGLLDPRGAEIHIIVRTHGPAISGMNHAMFTNYEVGCSPATSFGAGDGGNECADLQVAVFLPLGSSEPQLGRRARRDALVLRRSHRVGRTRGWPDLNSSIRDRWSPPAASGSLVAGIGAVRARRIYGPQTETDPFG